MWDMLTRSGKRTLVSNMDVSSHLKERRLNDRLPRVEISTNNGLWALAQLVPCPLTNDVWSLLRRFQYRDGNVYFSRFSPRSEWWICRSRDQVVLAEAPPFMSTKRWMIASRLLPSRLQTRQYDSAADLDWVNLVRSSYMSSAFVCWPLATPYRYWDRKSYRAKSWLMEIPRSFHQGSEPSPR